MGHVAWRCERRYGILVSDLCWGLGPVVGGGAGKVEDLIIALVQENGGAVGPCHRFLIHEGVLFLEVFRAPSCSQM